MRHGLPLAHLGGEVADDGLLGCVAKAHVVELHVAGDAVGGRGGQLGLLLGGVEELEDALGRGGHELQDVGHLRELGYGLREVLDVLDERLDVAHGDDAAHGEEAAQHRHRHVAGVAHEVHDRHHEAGEELRLPASLVEALVVPAKALDGASLLAERPHHRLAGERLLHLAVDGAKHGLLLAEVPLRAA